MANDENTKNPIAIPTENAQADDVFRTGSVLTKSSGGNFYCISIIGQVEGHYILEGNQKSTKYDHLIPLLVSLEESEDIEVHILTKAEVREILERGEMIQAMHTAPLWRYFAERGE